MKDKSKLLSSLIVSLLAGFIYYQVSDDFAVKFSSSVKAILISENAEMYGPFQMESYTSIVKKSTGIKKKYKSKLYMKSNINKKSVSDDASEELLISIVKSENQAKLRRPVADRNIDFTAELDKLTARNHKSLSELDEELRLKSVNKEFADRNEYNKVKMYIKKDKKNSGANGYGFEYNHINKESVKVKKKKNEVNGFNESNKEMKEIKSFYEYKSSDNCAPGSHSKVNCNKTKKYKNVKEKNEIIIPDNVLDDDTM